MYFYIYDSFLVDKKQSKVVSKIETKLASLDIAGKKYQLTILRSVREIINQILQKKESPTIIIVGEDKTFYQAAIEVAGTSAVLGYIPIEQDSLTADILGIPNNEYACDVISSRRVQKVSLGKINDQKFFSSIEFDPSKVKLIANDSYQIVPKRIKTVKIVNLDFLQFSENQNSNTIKTASNPKDNYLEVLMGFPGKKLWPFVKKEKKDSLFFVKKLKIKTKKQNQEILIKADKKDEVIKIKDSAIVTLDSKRINLIVGKDRLI